MGGRLDRPKRGEKISYEWGSLVVDAINDLITNPRVMPPLVVKDGAIGLGENYEVRLVKTTNNWGGCSGTTMGTGKFKFTSNIGTAMSDADGTYIERDGFSILPVGPVSGKYGYVAWVNGTWHLISVVC